MMSKMHGLGILHTDIVRKKLFDLTPDGTQNLPFEEGIYSKESTALVYGKLLMMAQEKIKKGCSIILDATFSRRHQRDEALRLARDLDANIIFVECTASRETLKRRLSSREATPTVSDARLRHFEKLKARFETITDLPEEMYIRINTETPMTKSLQQILSHDYLMLSQQTAVAMKSRAI